MTPHSLREVQGADLFDPFASSNIQEPYTYFARLRSEHPIYWHARTSFWMLTRYKDVRFALQTPSLFKSAVGDELLKRAEGLPAGSKDAFDICYRLWLTTILASDPPKHTAQRHSIMKAFTANVVLKMRESIEAQVDSLLDDIEGKRSVDFVHSFAHPLPATVIFNLLGVPQESRDAIQQMASWIVRFPPAIMQGDLQLLEHIAMRARQAETVIERLVEERRRTPTADLLSMLVNEPDANIRLPDGDIVVLASFLLVAGHETTANLLAGSMRHLLEQRSHWNMLLEAPEILGNAVEELLRFVSPLLWTTRLMSEDYELDGFVMKKGTKVQLGLGAANRDPARYESADELNLRRENASSLAFGYGPHFCLGATLARLETQIVLARVLKRFPGTQLNSSTFQYAPVFSFRALQSLPMCVAPS